MAATNWAETGNVVNLADARTRRLIRRSITEAAASGNAATLRERRVRAAAFLFACEGALDRHAALAVYDDGCAVDSDDRDPVTVARIVLGLPATAVPTAADFATAFGVEDPSRLDAARFVVETGGDLYCRLHGIQCDS